MLQATSETCAAACPGSMEAESARDSAPPRHVPRPPQRNLPPITTNSQGSPSRPRAPPSPPHRRMHVPTPEGSHPRMRVFLAVVPAALTLPLEHRYTPTESGVHRAAVSGGFSSGTGGSCMHAYGVEV